MSEENPDYLNMSDEEFLKSSAPDFDSIETDEPELDGQVEEDEPEVVESEQSEDDDELEGESDDTDEEEETDDDQDPSDDVEQDDDSTDDTEDDTDGVDNEVEHSEYKEQLDKLFAPFTATGRQVQVKTVDEAIQLMQMGVDYAKKMSAVKPHLRMSKTMQKHGVTEEELSFFIDLKNKKPEAIARYLKDANIDPLDLDLEKSSEYKPQSYTATDQEVELSQTLSEIKDLPGYKETLDIVGNKWDNQSRQVMQQSPQALKVLQAQVADGTYEKVMTEVDRQRLFGNLNGMSDLEAYDAVGQQLYGQAQEEAAAPQNQPKPKRVVKRVGAKKKDNPNIDNRRKSAALPSGGATSKTKNAYNPLDLSDEVFLKLEEQNQRFN